MLRDLCRILGQTYRLCIIDSRGELAAVQNSVPQYEIGLHTDVYDGFPRAEGAVMALRVMAPDGLVCDEISTAEDAAAVVFRFLQRHTLPMNKTYTAEPHCGHC